MCDGRYGLFRTDLLAITVLSDLGDGCICPAQRRISPPIATLVIDRKVPFCSEIWRCAQQVLQLRQVCVDTSVFLGGPGSRRLCRPHTPLPEWCGI